MTSKIVLTIALIVFVLAMPLLVFTLSVRLVVNDFNLYHNGFIKYNAVRNTGIELAELDRAAKELVEYFNSNEEYVFTKLDTGTSLYSQKETAHLKDVKDLVQLDYRLQWLTLTYVLAFAAVSLVRTRPAWRRSLVQLGRTMMFGGGLTLVLMAIIGLAMVVAFDRVFLAFHLLGFSNLLWVLDPATDKLIQMFPQGFFFDAALFLVGVTLVIALMVGAGGWVLNYYEKRHLCHV